MCVHEKNETKTHSYAHTYTNVWSCWKRESKIISLVWEPNENDWPNHFRLKIDVVDMKWIQYNCECVRSNREFVGVRVRVCDCDACCFIGVCVCVKPSSLSFRSKQLTKIHYTDRQIEDPRESYVEKERNEERCEGAHTYDWEEKTS